MTDSPTSLLGGLPLLQERIARHESSTNYSCSVARIGDLKAFEELPEVVTRVLVTIEYLGHSGLPEESLQRTLSSILLDLATDEKIQMLGPIVVALERSPEGACYTILFKFQEEEAEAKVYELTRQGFERLLKQNELKSDECLWVTAMKAGIEEYIHLLTRTSRMPAGPYPVFGF
jgi:hypothetical protein